MEGYKLFSFGLLFGSIASLIFFYTKKKREGLLYLKMYDIQDHYKNRATANLAPWPVVNTATTALASIERRGGSVF